MIHYLLVVPGLYLAAAYAYLVMPIQNFINQIVQHFA